MLKKSRAFAQSVLRESLAELRAEVRAGSPSRDRMARLTDLALEADELLSAPLSTPQVRPRRTPRVKAQAVETKPEKPVHGKATNARRFVTLLQNRPEGVTTAEAAKVLGVPASHVSGIKTQAMRRLGVTIVAEHGKGYRLAS